MIAALVGVALGVLTILAARAIRGERWLYAIGLLVLPGLYAFFALRVGDHGAIVEELTYGLPWLVAGLAFALLSIRHSAMIVGLLWIFHGLFDLVHDHFIDNAGVPSWYPAFCFSVDVVVGAYLIWLSRRIPRADLRHEVAA